MRKAFHARFGGFVVAAFAALAVGAPPAAAAPGLNTYVITVGGQATLIPPFGCSTGGPPAASGSFFSSAGVGGGVGVPTEGLATCGVAGGFNAQTGTVAPLSDTRSLSTTFNAGANSFNGSAAATARYGKVGAEAHAVTTGDVNSFIYYGAEAQAIFRDTYTITSPGIVNGTAGLVVYRFTVDGGLSVLGPGTSIVDVVYEQDSGPNFILMRASVDFRVGAPFITAFAGPGLSGFTATEVAGVSQSISGSGAFDTFSLPFVYGEPFELALGVRAWASPAISTNDIDFHTTVLMTGITPFLSGAPVDSFVVTSGSGTRYSANGVQLDQEVVEVPEPGALALLGTALLGLRMLRRRPA